MKIKIINWNLFEETNCIQFTRDKNIKDEFKVYAFYSIKKKKYILIYIDFINWKLLDFIIVNEAIEIIDKNIDFEFQFYKKFTSSKIMYDSLVPYKQTKKYQNLYAPKWMVEDKEFFLDIIEDKKVALDKFIKNTISPS